MQQEILRSCNSRCHTAVVKAGCPHPQNAVPIKYMLQDPETPDGKECKTCWFCRQKDKESQANYRESIRDGSSKQRGLVETGQSEFLHCENKKHGSLGSTHPRKKVPKVLFNREPGDANSDRWKTCLDCRKACAESHEINVRGAAKEKALTEGRIICSQCRVDITGKQIKNHDGSLSFTCR